MEGFEKGAWDAEIGGVPLAGGVFMLEVRGFATGNLRPVSAATRTEIEAGLGELAGDAAGPCKAADLDEGEVGHGLSGKWLGIAHTRSIFMFYLCFQTGDRTNVIR